MTFKKYKSYIIGTLATDIQVIYSTENQEMKEIKRVRLVRDAKAFINELIEKAEIENTENKEDKTMTVKEMREQAKALGIKGYSRMSKAELQTVLNAQETVETTETKDEPEHIETVVMKAFTGMVIGKFTAEFKNNTYTVTTKAGKQLHFDMMGNQIGAKNPKFANKIEGCIPDAFFNGKTTEARGGSIFRVVTLTKEQMNELGYRTLFNADDRQYIIMGDGTDAYAVAK